MYECHITLHLADAGRASSILIPGWKTSEIARDPVLGDDTHFYLTAHDRDSLTIYEAMRLMSKMLAESGIEIIRKKIELTVYDTKEMAGS
jgi:hypothetical protein